MRSPAYDGAVFAAARLPGTSTATGVFAGALPCPTGWVVVTALVPWTTTENVSGAVPVLLIVKVRSTLVPSFKVSSSAGGSTAIWARLTTSLLESATDVSPSFEVSVATLWMEGATTTRTSSTYQPLKKIEKSAENSKR